MGHNAVGFFSPLASGHDVPLVPKQALGQSGLFVSPVPWWAPDSTPVVGPPPPDHMCPAGTGPSPWVWFFADPAGTVLGRHDQRHHDLSGAWHKLRDDPILKFLITSLSFYGMSTFEGPMMSIKTVNALSHYTDWTVGHVALRCARLGGHGLHRLHLLSAPKLFGKSEMYSTKLVTAHFGLPPSALFSTSPRCGLPV